MSYRQPYPLGRVVPPDFSHVEKYPLRELAAPPPVPASVESVLELPSITGLMQWMDQGEEGACVGYSCTWAMTLIHGNLFNPRWLWNQAKLLDPWPDTNPGDDSGTSVHAGYDALRKVGHVLHQGRDYDPDLLWGVQENRWGQNADDLRACIALGWPVVLGINWYASFDAPSEVPGQAAPEWWIGNTDWLSVRGGHAICCRGASDKRQAALLQNSWGDRYPPVWISYEGIDRLIGEDGELGVITAIPEVSDDGTPDRPRQPA